MDLDFDKMNGLIPAVIQDSLSKNVLMLGYMNEEAYKKTQETGLVTFYSRSKQRLWTKGEESGNFLKVVDILVDCDNDTILIKASPSGPVCHTGTATCFEKLNENGIMFLNQLQELIDDRRDKMPKKSYTTKLFKKGIDKIAQKVGEEAIELVIESKNRKKEMFKDEAADLIYHLLVLLSYKKITIEDIAAVLEARHLLK
jgi:phosphoribosyl-ATP pyrophosphohydrolase/phosphoribosyl-AMP cyclohydrolase